MDKKLDLSKRQFLQQTSMAFGATILSLPFSTKGTGMTQQHSTISFALLADIHADLIPDKKERLEEFIEEAISKEVDFILQLGDFCFPKKENLDFLSIWNQFKGLKYHVLGNHDMDVSSKEETMAFWKMEKKYYSFDCKDFHFVVLDANYLFIDGQYKNYEYANFYINDNSRTFINPTQIEWLIQDLEQTNLPTIIFSHQSLVNPIWGIKNRIQIQELLEKENQRAGFQKIIACFNGHDHIDFYRMLNRIHYIEINSMSYQWLGEKYSNKDRYPAGLYEKYKHLDKIAPYKDALYAFVEVDTTSAQMSITGIQSEWLAPSPKELKLPEQVYGTQYSPEISNRVIELMK